MPFNVLITRTETSSVEVPDEVAETLRETYEALDGLDNRNLANLDFNTYQEANKFAKQARVWAAENGLTFARKGSGQGRTSTRVTFRIYAPKGTDE